MGSLPVWLVGALAVQIDRDVSFGPARIGLSSGVFFGCAACGSAVMGRVAQRRGPTAAMRTAVLGSALIQCVLAATTSFPIMLAALAVAGAGNSLAQVGANLLIAEGVAPERQGLALAIKQAGVPAGTLLGGLAVPVLGVTVGWRWAFVVGAVGALAAALTVPRVPRDERIDRSVPPLLDVPVSLLVSLAIAVGFASAANGTLASFLVSAGVDAGLGESEAGLVLTMGSAIGITMRLVAGARADRRGGAHLPVVALLLVGGTAGYLLLAPGAVVTHLVGAAIAFGSGWAWPGLFNLAVVRLNPAAPAAATGITQTGVYVGALIGPVVFGFVADHSGYPTAWLLAAGSSMVAAAGIWSSRRRLLRWRESQAGIR